VSLFGKDLSFYTLLEQQAEAAHRAAKAFHALTKDFSRCAEYVKQIEDIEHEADDITHQLANKVDRTFVTPLDKEDLHALSSGLDDITDMIEATTARISLYRLESLRPDLEPLVFKLVQVTQATHEAVKGLRDLRNRTALHNAFIHIHELENESDQSFRNALGTLFNSPNPDPLMVMKWKEVYDRVETAVDKCEDVANIVESVVVKYA
jgi:predicted phosphate transport protein (TIGR00153 family)